MFYKKTITAMFLLLLLTRCRPEIGKNPLSDPPEKSSQEAHAPEKDVIEPPFQIKPKEKVSSDRDSYRAFLKKEASDPMNSIDSNESSSKMETKTETSLEGEIESVTELPVYEEKPAEITLPPVKTDFKSGIFYSYGTGEWTRHSFAGFLSYSRDDSYGFSIRAGAERARNSEFYFLLGGDIHIIQSKLTSFGVSSSLSFSFLDSQERGDQPFYFEPSLFVSSAIGPLENFRVRTEIKNLPFRLDRPVGIGLGLELVLD